MLNGPFSPWPKFSEEEMDAVKNVLMSNKVNYWTGNQGKKFEAEFADYVGTKYSIALSNGTVALDLALNALSLVSGDEVIVASRTYIASVSSIVIAGANPVFADIDPNSQNITAETIALSITPRTKAIVCVHLAGWPCEMDKIMALAKRQSLVVIEDCAQAHGAAYSGQSVGSFGHIACWSFCQDKIMTTGGEGGMVTTNEYELWQKMWSFKDHGKSWNAVYKEQHPPGFKWLSTSFGTNFRMTEMQAAIGRIQLKKIKDWHKKRINNAKMIWGAAKKNPKMRVPEIPDSIEHGAYKAYVFIKGTVLQRDMLVQKINDHGVPCFSGSCSEVYLEKAFENTNFRPKHRLPVAKRLGETSLMFLCHPTLMKKEIELTCDILEKIKY
ncbi:DegT/DnrJ/EryC1/StrS aminotransferase family protein [Amylibacter sp.]|nr:DegT/DnrJ/EryC1/StrS aminotransferase family protein [Amylibacter sp.]